ncbi:MAG: amino acid adenylation domain-containing protein [Nostoc sp. DedQUE12b]|uniref:amino acid adenylation domain-containing protein n=1 Tax=Nostoc sp. DedQUE12b TaxID=3075398 RepID=UPI002AD272BA|nr:amino acid adenylation domain-containing protein [Nostoc sp. DedQUE12b]MDZ8085086.1 amino acid adenylation domain-containing protein [Nostoc sp. DedQUE12b]
MNQNNIEDIYELSPLQQGMLFHTLVTPNSGMYFEQFCYALQTQVDVPAFQKAWQRVLDRHPILRTSFYWENLDKPYQVVYRQVDLPWDFQDWRELSSQEQEKHLEAFLAADCKQGFTLSQVPLIRLALIQVADKAYQFVFSYHHILMEGWSLTWLWKEFYEFYNAFYKGQDLYLERPRPFREYISWLQQQDISKAEVYWRETLRGFTVPTPLMMDKATDTLSKENEDHDCQKILLSVTTTDALNSLTRKYHLTLNILLKGAWAILLSRYSGESDIVFGATSSGRPTELAEAESMMGLFANTLPLRVQVESDALLIPWLKKLQVQEVEMRQYEYSPLLQIQQWSEIPRGLPLFESILSFNNYLIDSTKEKLAESLALGEARIFEKTNYPLTIQVYPGSNLLLSIGYDTRCFDSATINRILGHLKTLLEGIVANPEQQLRDLPLLTAQEKYQLLLEWNDTEVKYPQEQCIHQLFEAQVERTPDAVAVVFESEQLTYRQLNTKANQLAHYLRSLGVKPEVLVGICVERSLSMVIGLLAILKAGGAYIPLDPSYPKERLAYMLEDSCPGVLLTQQNLVKNLLPNQAQVICIDSDWELIADENTENPGCNITVDNLAYVIYTSGSTGQPKGAMNTHRGICNRLLWMQDAYQLTAADSVLQKTPFSFDVSVWEFFWTLIVGARLVVAQPEGHKDPNYLVNLILQEKITTLHFVPSMMQVFLSADGLERCQSLVKVMVSGEALPVELQQRFFNRLDAQLHNLYGPTETAVDVTFWQCQDSFSNQKIVPIGRPIANIQIYLLDQYLNPVPVGILGEVYIGGVGIGRGYLNRPDLTAEKFIPNPFHDKAGRLYKTGDIARYLPSGEIEYIGRIDHQVKVRGFRIELGEIEALITQHPAVRETVVVVREDSIDSKNLVAYIVAQREQTLIISELRNFLESKLPNYMMPTAFITLEALPLTPNGKVDRFALPAPDTARPELEAVYQPPQTEVEKTITDIWQEVLNVENIGIHDNFFELGGHSLLLVQIHSKLQKIFPRDFLLVEMFQYPTISHLARYFNQESKEETSFIKHSHVSEGRTASLQRRKQARKEHRTAIKESGVSSQSGEQNL